MPTRNQLKNAKKNSVAAVATTSGGGVTGAAPSPDLCTPSASGGVTAAPDLCGTCNLLVGDNSIGCDKCEVWLHATEMCSGLPQKVIDVILEYSGEGINYMCMKCRVTRASTAGQGSGGSPSARADKFMADTLQQLFQQLRGMTTVLSSLSAEVRTLSTERESRNNPTQPNPSCGPPAPSLNLGSFPPLARLNHDIPPPGRDSNLDGPSSSSLDQYRLIVRKELREMHERDKRRDSIIVRGLKATTPGGVVDEFCEISQRKMGARVVLSDVVIIPGHSGICRAKIPNPAERKLVLDQAKELRHTEYKHVYIRRDLTFAQRGELRLRREADAASKQPGSAAAAELVRNSETVPKTVWSPDQLPQAADGGTATPPSGGNPQGPAPSSDPPHSDRDETQN